MANAIAPGTLGPFGNIYSRGMVFPLKEDFIDFHSHDYDHVLILLKGSVRVNAVTDNGNGVRITRDLWSVEAAIREGGPLYGHDPAKIAAGIYGNASVCFALIKATTWHRLEAREDLTVGMCQFAHYDSQGNLVMNYVQSSGIV